MKSISVSDANVQGRGYDFTYDAGDHEATFSFPAPNDKDEPLTIRVRTDGATLRFYPRRSALHRRVLKAIGIEDAGE
jgi:hypothetical protein